MKSRGQSLIESCFVIGILCLVLMGLLQLSQLYMAGEILDYAAGRGARAAAVGFNDFMIHKVVRVATIANAGPITSPTDIPEGAAQPVSMTLGPYQPLVLPMSMHDRPTAQRAVERARIPLYLEAHSGGELPAILDYTNWSDIRYDSVPQSVPPILHFTVSQAFPLSIPLHRTFVAADTVSLQGESYQDDHATLYLNRQ